MLIFLNDFRQCSVKCSDKVKQKEPKSFHYREKKPPSVSELESNTRKTLGGSGDRRKVVWFQHSAKQTKPGGGHCVTVWVI